jgi:hypothetical protein
VSVLEDLRGIEARVVARLNELRPLVEEYAELEQVAARLGFDVSSPSAKPSGRDRPRARRQAKPTSARRSHTSSRRDGRSRPGGTQATGAERRARIIDLIKEQPGITVSEISGEIGVEPPPIYRVIRRLQADGVVKKEGKELRLAG